MTADEKSADKNKLKATKENKSVEKNKRKATAKSKSKCTKNIAQVDGIDDTLMESDSECENIMQLDGNDDTQVKTRSTRTRAKKFVASTDETVNEEGVSPPKRAKTNAKSLSTNNKGETVKSISITSNDKPVAPKSDEQPEAPKSPLRKRTIRNKDTKDTSKLLEKDVKDKNAKDITDKPQSALKSTLRNRSVRNKNGTSNSNSANTKGDSSKAPQNISKAVNELSDVTHMPQEAPKSPLRRRTVRNKDDISKNASTSTKQGTSKFSQTQSNNQLDKNNKNNGAVKDSISLSLKKAFDDEAAKLKDRDNSTSPCKTRTRRQSAKTNKIVDNKKANAPNIKLPIIMVTDEDDMNVESKFFSEATQPTRICLSRKRSHTTVNAGQKTDDGSKNTRTQTRTKSAGAAVEKSKYFDTKETVTKKPKLNTRQTKKEQIQEDKLRVSHKDLRQKTKPKNDVTEDLVDIIKSRIKSEKAESVKGIVKGMPFSKLYKFLLF